MKNPITSVLFAALVALAALLTVQPLADARGPRPGVRQLPGLPAALPAILPGEGAAESISAPAEQTDRPRSDDSYALLPGEFVPTRVLVRAQVDGGVPEWGVRKILAPEAWAATKGKGVVVAVLDTGCDPNHPDLRGAIKAAKDFTGSSVGPSDVQGHGTHCAGVVGARGTIIGVAPECLLLVGKVLGDEGWGTDQAIADGLDWARASGADVVSMSLGSSQPSMTIRTAVQRCVSDGVIVVAAAGNSGPGEGTVGYPGGFPECVCVAATDASDRIAQFSSRGPAVFVAAPGVNVRSTYPGGRYAEMSGTSMATPHVAGAAALWVATHQSVARKDRPAAFLGDSRRTEKDLPPVGRDTGSGFGLVQAKGLVAGVTPPPPPPTITLTDADLTPEARERLRGATFRLEVVPK